MAPAVAAREARRQFGNVAAIRERTRDQWGSPTLDAVYRDLRFGARMITRAPGLGAVVVLTIALGGATVFLILTTAIAAWLPARRAASIDPVRALQSE